MSSLIQNDQLNSWITDVMQTTHARDFTEFIGQAGYINLNQFQNNALFNWQSGDVNNEAALILKSGQAKIYSLEGNLLATKVLLEEILQSAIPLITQNTNQSALSSLAYVLYEYGLFNYKVKDFGLAVRQFKQSQNLNKSDRFQILVNYQLETLRLERNRNLDLNQFEDLVAKFEKKQMHIMHILGMHRLGVFHRIRDNKPKASECYDIAMVATLEYGYVYLESLLHNAIGFLKINQGKLDEALDLFHEKSKIAVSNYQKVLMIENIALIHYRQKDFSTAADYCYQALEISQKHHVLSQIPEECLFLGEVYLDNLKNSGKAEYFYHQGYDAAMFQVSHGLTMGGSRSKAIDTYMEFLRKYYTSDQSVELPEQLFTFAIGKSWSEIKDLFRYNLLIYAKLEMGGSKNMFSQLKMKETNFYTLQSRLAKKGFVFPDFRSRDVKFPEQNIIQSLQSYIQSLGRISWKSANKKFEEDIIKYLFGKYGYQKKRLAAALGISMPSILRKTQPLTNYQEEAQLKIAPPPK